MTIVGGLNEAVNCEPMPMPFCLCELFCIHSLRGIHVTRRSPTREARARTQFSFGGRPELDVILNFVETFTTPSNTHVGGDRRQEWRGLPGK